MKQAIKERLKRYPFVFGLSRRIYRTFFPTQQQEIQKIILKHIKHKNSIFFVQVGSNDGLQGDPFYDIIVTNNKWKGIFIEPVGFLFERLKRHYGNSDRFIFENKAIAPSQGELEFFYVSEQAKAELGDALPWWYDQIGSFDKNHILKHLDGLLEPYILSEKINAVPLHDIFDKHKVKEVDIVHIDTEGYDYKVLSTINFSIYKPSVILYEHHHLSDVESKAAELLLKKNGYSCFQYGGDTLALSDEIQ
jgi:FkbM family methyltransferase